MTTPIFRLYPKEFGDEPPPGFSSRAKFIHQALHLIDRSLATSGQKLMLRAMLVEGASVDGMMNVAWMVHNLDDPHDDVGPLADSFINLVVKPGASARVLNRSFADSPYPCSSGRRRKNTYNVHPCQSLPRRGSRSDRPGYSTTANHSRKGMHSVRRNKKQSLIVLNHYSASRGKIGHAQSQGKWTTKLPRLSGTGSPRRNEGHWSRRCKPLTSSPSA
jgi:hypothetical protein